MPTPSLMSTATSRLRHTFKYPSDTSTSTSPSPSASRDELDEEEQESLVSHLSTSATQHDSTYRLVFTALPLLAILPFLYHTLTTPSRSTALPAVLAVTSLGITSYSMWSVRVDEPLSNPSKRPSTIFARQDARASASTGTAAVAHADGPLLLYLPYLNAAIAVLLLLLSFLYWGRRDVSEGFWLLLLLPAVMLGVVAVVKGSMMEIQSGLGELRGLRYEYKGA